MKTLNPLLALLPASVLMGCASDISPSDNHSNDGEPGSNDEPSLTEPGPGGTEASFKNAETGEHVQAQINASGSDWIYIDLDTQTQVFPDNPEASDGWDVAHNGADIKLNGGVSGQPPNGVAVQIYADKVDSGTAYPWNTIVAAPPPSAVSYVTDTEGSGLLGRPSDTTYAMGSQPEADAQPNPATGAGDYGWYNYSGFVAGSVVSARDNVAYVLRTDECRYLTLRFTSYTDSDGQSGFVQYDLREIPGPECVAGGLVAPSGAAQFTSTADGYRVEASANDEEAWVYIDLTNAAQALPNDPQNDATAWDIALKRTDIQLNGGSSGAGNVAIHDMLHGDWDSIASVPGDADFHTDEAEALAFVTYPEAEDTGRPACGSINSDFGWYNYSGFCDEGQGQHHISARDVVYIVQGRDGNYWKLRMLGYYNEDGESGHPFFEFAPISP